MKNTYILKIDCSEDISAKVSQTLGVGQFDSVSNTWSFEIIENLSEPPIDFISRFLAVIEENDEYFYSLGIRRSDISVWRLYEYDEQCNMELAPDKMKRLGEQGIGLCMSCWQA